MDEIDSDDITELESLLYAQIHHQAVDEPIPKQDDKQNVSSERRIVTAASVINRPSFSRYWCKNLDQSNMESGRGNAESSTITVAANSSVADKNEDQFISIREEDPTKNSVTAEMVKTKRLGVAKNKTSFLEKRTQQKGSFWREFKRPVLFPTLKRLRNKQIKYLKNKQEKGKQRALEEQREKAKQRSQTQVEMDKIDVDSHDVQVHHAAVDESIPKLDDKQNLSSETQIVTPASVINRPDCTRNWSKNLDQSNIESGRGNVDTSTTIVAANLSVPVANSAVPTRITEDPNTNLVTSEMTISKRQGVAKNTTTCMEKRTQQKGPFGREFKRPAEFPRLERLRDNEQKYIKKKQEKEKKRKLEEQREKEKELVIISIDSSDESQCDDVVLIPEPPPPTITLDESDDDGIKLDVIQLDEENAMDSTDVGTSAFFQARNIHCEEAGDVSGKIIEQSQRTSRCTSPSSVLSSDDFIGQTDRRRLLLNNSIADDEDLVSLTADLDSYIQTPQQMKMQNKNVTAQVRTCVEDDVVCTGEFASPTNFFTSNASAETGPKKNNNGDTYRVDQTQFRALDVYESESDIAESVYSKGGRKTTTVVLAASSSSEEVDNIENTPINQKSKRFIKRRSMSTNPNCNVHDSNSSNSECENKDIGGTASTGLPFIKRGEAIPMKISVRKRRSQSTTLSRTSPKSKTSSGHMSDTEFIETLNNLAHGLDENKKLEAEDVSADEVEKKSDSDVASVVSVKIVKYNNPKHEEAIPEDAICGLNKVFDFIDNFPAVEAMSSHSSSSYDVEMISMPVAEKPVEDVSDNGPKYHTIYSKEHFHNSGFGWNEEMDKFYNSSWKGEHFSLAAIQRGMNRDKKLWKIYSDDRFPKIRPYSNLKCYNCCEFGHVRAKCSRPKKPPVCYMCGETGHFEVRCPNTICLRCGNKTAAFIKGCESCSFQDRLICPICKVRGHSINLCPDKWRRYHSTTTMNCYPNNSTRPNLRKACCVCGRMGHYPETCRTRLTDYPIIVSKAKSHEKSYCDLARLETRNGIPFNLLYNPKDSIQFHLAEKTKRTDCYGRFLNAVGMQRSLKRKRLNENMEKSERPLKRSKNTSKSKELVSSNAVFTISEQVQDSTETNNINCTVASPTKNATVEDIVVVDCSSPSSTNSNDESNSSPSTSKKVIAALSDNKRENDPIIADYIPLTPSTSKKVIAALSDNKRENDPIIADYIPLTENNEKDKLRFEGNNNSQRGISSCFSLTSNDEDNDERARSLQNSACEAKVYLTNFHSNYLLSPKGQEFLRELSLQNNVKARLDNTSVGHVLILFGLPNDQDEFHSQLLVKYRELSDNMNNEQLKAAKVPKKSNALISFLRANVNQLQNNLGDVNELHNRISRLELHHTKESGKIAEKCRRVLNMILLGQAGLCGGDVHLDKLLTNMRTLITGSKTNCLVPTELREEIDTHFKVIFTSYRHNNYPELIQNYYNMTIKNRIPKLNIHPWLLGQKFLNTNPTMNEQKRRTEQLPVATVQKPTELSYIKEQNLPYYQYRARQSQLLSNKSDSLPSTSSLKMHPNPRDDSTVPPAPSMTIQPSSSFDMRRSGNIGNLSEGPSLFWSQQSSPYLEECIRLRQSDSERLNMLHRIQSKSRRGALSYKDYRAVIKIHGALVGK